VIFALGLDSGGVGSLGRGPLTLAIALFGTPTPRSHAAFELHPHRKTAAPHGHRYIEISSGWPTIRLVASRFPVL
jgi:hypothetical protein